MRKNSRKDYYVLSGTVSFNAAKHVHALRSKSDLMAKNRPELLTGMILPLQDD